MNLLNLPFDAEQMLSGLKPWIECESPTYDAVAVNRMMDLAAYDLAGGRDGGAHSRPHGFWRIGARTFAACRCRKAGYPYFGAHGYRTSGRYAGGAAVQTRG